MEEKVVEEMKSTEVVIVISRIIHLDSIATEHFSWLLFQVLFPWQSFPHQVVSAISPSKSLLVLPFLLLSFDLRPVLP